jgi:hypothetical protein
LLDLLESWLFLPRPSIHLYACVFPGSSLEILDTSRFADSPLTSCVIVELLLTDRLSNHIIRGKMGASTDAKSGAADQGHDDSSKLKTFLSILRKYGP